MKTVKVRIAVAVGPDGGWACAGWSGSHTTSDADKMDMACEGIEPGEARYWLEAELAVPESAIVTPVVSKEQ